MTTLTNEIIQLIEAYKAKNNFDKRHIESEIKLKINRLIDKENLMTYDEAEKYYSKNNIDINIINQINGVLHIQKIENFGDADRYFEKPNINTYKSDIENTVLFNTNAIMRIKKDKKSKYCKVLYNDKLGKIASNVQKYVRDKNIKKESKDILQLLSKKVDRYKNVREKTNDSKKLYEKYRKEYWRTKKAIESHNNENETTVKKILYNYPNNNTQKKNKISNRNETNKSFIMPGIYRNLSKKITSYHDFNKRSLSKIEIKTIYNDIHKSLRDNYTSDKLSKKSFNYYMNHFLKTYSLNGSEDDNYYVENISQMSLQDKEIARNRLLTSFYNNLNHYIDKHIVKYGEKRLSTGGIHGNFIHYESDYKVCYTQFANLMKYESNLANLNNNNNHLDKIRNDYYLSSFFISSLKKKNLIDTYFKDMSIFTDREKWQIQKIKKVFSPFRLCNRDSILTYDNNNFQTKLLNITKSNVLINATNVLCRDHNNISPIDIFYSYGIPTLEINNSLKKRIGLNSKEAAIALRDLYTYQVTMIDSLRLNRIKNMSSNTLKKISIFNQKNNTNKIALISHPFNTKVGFMLPLPIEYIDLSNIDIAKKIIASYVRLFDLPKPGFLFGSNSDINFRDISIEMYLKYLKERGFASYLTHYLINYLHDTQDKFGDFIFLKFLFLLELENGNNRHFSINFPIRINDLNNLTNITEDEIHNRITMELRLQLELYDEDEGIFELYIVDITIEFLTNNNNNNPYGLSGFGNKIKKRDYNIWPIFQPCFPDLNICLFECFFYLYHCKIYNLECKDTKIEDIQRRLNILNWIDYKCYLVNFLYSLEVIPELKEACIIGDVKSMISILISNYSLRLGVYNTFDESFYPEDMMNDSSNISEILIWTNFHVYISTKENYVKYIRKKNRNPDAIKYNQYTMEPMLKEKKMKDKEFENIIISLDIETLTDDNGLLYGNQKPYLIQTISGLNQLDQTFWGVDDCVNNFIDWIPMLFEFDRNVYIFTHNGSKFDYRFLLSELMKKYSVITTGDHNKIIVFQIRNIYFMDFFLFFPTSLNNLSKSWLGESKLDFDHSIITIDNYNNFKENAIEYCKQDCLLLFKIVNKFLEAIFSTVFKDDKKLHETLNFYTAPQLALRIYKTIYLQMNLIGSRGQDYYTEKQSYYGGMCVVYRMKIKEEIYCYDLNSCYPASMLLKMPVIYWDEKEAEIEDILFIDHYLYMIDYEFPINQIIVNLPTRYEDEIVYIGKNQNKWHWGNEIKLAQKLGGKILKVHRVRRYEGHEIFKEYITDIYGMRLKAKDEGNTCLVDFLKLLMNSLYGKLGQKLNLQKNIVSIAELSEVVRYYNENKIKNIKLLDSNCVEYEYDDLTNHYNQIGSLVRISSFITAQSRCLLLAPFADGHVPHEKLYYTDTDSIFVGQKLPNQFVSNRELGKYKLEYTIKDGEFLAPKMYVVRTIDNEIKMKMKGIPQRELEEKFYYDLISTGSKEIKMTLFKTHFSQIRISEMTKRIILKKYKRNYYENTFNSKVWNNLDEFINVRNEQLNYLKNLYPKTVIIKTDKKKLQTLDRKNNTDFGIKIELIAKYNYVMTYDEFYEYFKQIKETKNLIVLWNTTKGTLLNRQYEYMLNVFPMFSIPRLQERSKVYSTDEMVTEIVGFILGDDHSKDEYYRRIDNFLLSCKAREKPVLSFDQLIISPEVTKSQILDYYNMMKEKNPRNGDYANKKNTLIHFCPNIRKKEDLKQKRAHASLFYAEMMNFYMDYILNNAN